MYNASAQVCSTGNPAAGCDFSWTGQKVVLTNDPLISTLGNYSIAAGVQPGGTLGWDYADQITINGKTYTGGLLGNPSVALSGGWVLSTSNEVVGFAQNYWRLVITSPEGIDSSAYQGKALNFVSSTDGGRDIVGSQAEKEESSRLIIAQGLQAKYGLDADVSINAAKLIESDIKRPTNRGYSEEELSKISAKMYGIDLGNVKSAINKFRSGDIEGGKQDAHQLIIQASTKWKTSPENMERIIRDFYGNLLPAQKDQ